MAMHSVVILILLLFITLIFLVIVNSSLHRNRRLKKYFGYYKKCHVSNEETELFLINKISDNWFNGNYKSDLKSDMKILNLYTVANSNLGMDDMDCEELLLELEDHYNIKFNINEINDHLSIRSLSEYHCCPVYYIGKIRCLGEIRQSSL